MSLRLRLNLLITIIMILFLIGLSITLMKSSKKAIEEGVESSHRVTLQLLDTFITSSVQNPEWGYTHEVIQPFLMELGHVRSNVISLYDLNNHLLYQTPVSTYRKEINPPIWFKSYMTPPKELNAKIILIRTSGGIGKNELSTKAMTASAQSARGCPASESVQS